MILQVLLVALFICLAIYGRGQLGHVRVASVVVIVLSCAGVAFTLFPEISTYFAAFLGVGRGVDLIFYLFMVITITILFRYFILLRQMEDKLTQLARNQAIAQAQNHIHNHEPSDRKGEQ